MNQLRLTKQQVRETGRMRDEMAAMAHRAARAPAGSVTAPAGGLGWKLVPMEITDAMRNAAAQAGMEALDLRDAGASNVGLVPKMYEAMLAAAPTPPTHAADSVLEDVARWFSERDNVLHSFWVLLGEAETQADNDNNSLLKHQVKGFYRQWNALNGSALEPRWVTRAARKQGGKHD